MIPVMAPSLARRLKALVPALDGADDGALEAILRGGLLEARNRWPGIALEDGAFLEHVSRHAPKTLAALTPLDFAGLFLARACASGDRAALDELERTILSQVTTWVARIPGARAEEVRQELRVKLLLSPTQHILDYGGRGALDRWIRVVAHRCAIDQQRALTPGSSDALEDLWSHPEPELDLIKLRDREALRSVLHDVLQALPDRERNLLRLHYLEGMPLAGMAALEGVNRSTVARWLADARSRVLDQARELLRARLRLSAREGESLLRFVRSRLDLSLRRVLS
jgi:RNA polymerase sigma-70 factor (ECF subfamily)